MAQTNAAFTTPKGIAQYPWLSKPDTKFSEDGEYKVNLILSKEEALPILKQINEVYAENISKETKKAKGVQVKKAPPPWQEEMDDAGQPTGNIILKFKSKAAYKPAIFDAKGIPMVNSNIWGGSELKVAGTIAPYYTSLIGAGVALRLRAVQVIQYVDGTQGASRFGFEEEAGYIHENKEEKQEDFFEGDKPEAEVTAEVEEVEPEVRPDKPTPQPADDLSDIINQWSKD